MQPKIIQQKKVLIKTNENQNPSHLMSSRLSFTPISQVNGKIFISEFRGKFILN